MKFELKATNLILTPALKIYVEKKNSKLDKFVEQLGESVMLWIELARSTRHHKSGDVFYAELNLRLPQKTLRAEENSSDVRAALDLATDDLLRQVKTHLARVHEKNRRIARKLKEGGK